MVDWTLHPRIALYVNYTKFLTSPAEMSVHLNTWQTTGNDAHLFSIIIPRDWTEEGIRLD
jgi:hypothetical protein